MQKLILGMACLFLLTMTAGCNNLSPRDNLSPQLDQQLESLEGNQNTLENNMNAIKLELGRLNQSLSMANSNDNEIQQGWVNIQSDGILITVFATIVISMLLYYMYRSKHYKDVAEIISNEVKEENNEDVKERVMAAAWNTHVEKTVYKLIR